MSRQEAMDAALSHRYEERLEAAGQLARYSDVETTRSIALLLRDEDVAVIEAAAEALLRRGDRFGAELYCAALADGDDQVGDTLLTLTSWIWHGEGVPVPELYREVLRHSERPRARTGAAGVLAWLGVGTE